MTGHITRTTLDLIPPLEQCLFVPIDVQREFCDPHYDQRGNDKTVAVSEKIAHISPLFNQRALRTCWVYYDDNANKPRPKKACGGFYKVTPAKDDFLVCKNNNSAFMMHPSPLENLLEDEKITTLVVAGVNLSACVKETVQGALCHGYDVILLEDLCANDNHCHGGIGLFQSNIRDHLKYHEKFGSSHKAAGKISYTTSDVFLELVTQKHAKTCESSSIPNAPNKDMSLSDNFQRSTQKPQPSWVKAMKNLSKLFFPSQYRPQ